MVSETDSIDSLEIDWTVGLKEASETLREGAEEFRNLATSTKDTDKQFLYRRLGGICSFMSSLYLVTLNTRRDLDGFVQFFNKLPDDPRFSELKGKIEQIKQERLEITLKTEKELEKELIEMVNEWQKRKKASTPGTV